MPDRKTILLVEDEALIRLSETKMLEKEGYAVIGAGSGEEALEIAQNGHSIDLILMDIDLGKGMDGTESAREILKDHDIPIMFLASHTENEIVEKTETIKAYGYVVKTSGDAVINASIKMAFKLHKAHMEVKATKNVLENSERKYRRLFEAAKDGILIISADTGLITDCNPFLARLLGYTSNEVNGKFLWDISPFKDIAANSEAFLKLSENEYIRYDDLPLETKDGKRVDVEFVSNVYLVDNAKVIQCNIRDITGHKRMERALRESEEQLRKMFKESPIGMVTVGADFRFIRTNEAFCRMLGYTERELTSLTFVDITHPDYIDENVLRINDLISGRIPFYQTEKRYVRKDKGVVWGSTIINVMRDRDGLFLCLFTNVEDITQRKQSEQEKTLLESQLFQSQKMEAIGTLAAGIAHDFNNILTVITGFSSLLEMGMKKDNPQRAFVDQILAASEKAAHLTGGLLAFSRKQQISLKPLDVNIMIKDTSKLLKRLLTEDIELKIKLFGKTIVIMADASQIDQILFNLATNARDAMPRGGTLIVETKVVELDDEFIKMHGYGQPGEYALLSISDTGSGMDKATRERIFDPFFTTKEVGKGTGLGLSTAYGIVKQHNGYITAYSEPDVGTTFHIYIPVVVEITREEKEVRAPIKGGDETILVAEDDRAVRTLIKNILSKYGYTIIEAIDGADAVEQSMKADSIDLLILDSVMPKKNGREAYIEIHKIKPDIRVIFTSGYTRDVFLDKGIKDEEFNFLQKPILPDVLLQKVRDMLDDRQGSR